VTAADGEREPPVSAGGRPKLPASVIIPSRGRPGLLADTVESILAGDDLPAEILVVDQSPAENARLARLTEPPGSIVRYERRPGLVGVSAARNEACSLAREHVLVFTDDDVFVDPDWLGTVVAAVLSDPRVLVSGRVLPADTDRTDGFAPSCIESDEPKTYEGRVWDDVLFSNNMAFAREVYDDLGPFDDRLGVGSPYRAATDNDYGFRALEAGYRIRYLPEAVVHHRAFRPMAAYPRLMWNYGVGQGACFTKHASLRDRYSLHRLRDSIARRFRIAADRRGESRYAAFGEGAYALGLLYGSTRWLLVERLRGR
jgi:glycosyltransferase involved in cell wall biosynthesis